ncbi:MAG: hypothetical protein JSR77_09415 [Planctomycetes bacterium]|nr:hypothetical protein [Planctomycetota bacterium]
MKRLALAVPSLVLASSTFAQETDSSRAYAAELVADAANRTSLADDGSPSGYKNGKFTLTDGGPNVLNVGGFLQARYLGNFRQDRPDGSHDTYTGGFQIQRARLKLDGTVWDKALSYNFLTELSGKDGTAQILDAEGRYTFENKAYIRFGQYKPFFNREELVSDTFQLTVERSVTNAIFSMTRSQGMGIGWQNEKFRVGADITDGSNALNTSFDSPKEADFAINARGEWMWKGDDFKRFNDFTSWRGQGYAGLLGAGIDYETYGDTGGGAVEKQLLKATADVSIEGDGWNAFAAFIWQETEPDAGENTNDFGVVVQGGLFVTEQCELFARYDVILPDNTDGPDDFNSVTAGLTYYVSPKSHAFKLTGDVVWYIDPESSTAIVPAPSTSLDLLTDSAGNQVAFRLQAQIVF